MTKEECSFQQLPFSKLFNTYTSEYEKLSEFYTANPFNDAEVKQRIERIGELKNRSLIADAFKEYHAYLGIELSQASQLEKFRKDDALVFVTGQQLGVYGGPLFTIYKTITSILLARKWEKELGRPVVPVFWLADEDHDFEEIASIGIPENDSFSKPGLSESGNGMPVSVQAVSDSIKEFRESVKELLFDTDFSEDMWSKLDGFYQPGKTHVQSFAQLIDFLFAEEGLLIVGSNTDSLKGIVKDIFTNAVTNASEVQKALEEQSVRLENKFHRQVVVGESNLFYLDSEKGRVKLDRSGSDWKVGSITMSEEKLVKLIEANPGKFSPNVFLRPVVQDAILPTIGYVAGPGELAYYGQMKELYPLFGLEMPVIYPRLSATLIESGVERIMEKLPFEFSFYNQRIEDLESAYVEHAKTKDVEKMFSMWKDEISGSSDYPVNFIKQIDPTLEGTVGKVVAGFSNELDKLKGRVYRSIKQQEQTQLTRIHRIKIQLFPDGLQERSVSPVYFMNKYGTSVWKELIQELGSEDIDLSTHHIIKI